MWEDWSSENSYVNPLGRFEDGSEHRWTPEGLPVVQKTLTYGELLSDIRDGKVRELVRWDSLESHTGGPDMRCLVVYMNKSVARATRARRSPACRTLAICAASSGPHVASWQ